MQSRKKVFLGLGSNVGDRIDNLIRAIDSLSEIGYVKSVSTVYESEPWGVEDQPPFLNCVVEIETELSPRELLTKAKELEIKLGRIKRSHWGPREIDIDILIYDEVVMDEEDLKIPHPFIEKRDFVIVPLLEIDPEVVNPKSGKPYALHAKEITPRLKPTCCILNKEGKPSVGTLP